MIRLSYSIIGLFFLTLIVASCAKKELPTDIYFTENITIYPSDAWMITTT